MQTENHDYLETLSFSERAELYEIELQSMWNRIPVNTFFQTADGTDFKIISRGIWNRRGGPDFRDAKIDFNGRVRQGDIEIHLRSSDWIRHNHSKDEAYGDVILHVVGINDASPSNVAFLPDIPVFVMDEEDDFEDMDPVLTDIRGGCSSFFESLTDRELFRFLEDAGLERMQIKSEKILKNMIRYGMGESFLMALFDFTGFGRNREAFQELGKRILEHSREERERDFEVILWGESGLLPDLSSTKLPPDAEDYARKIWGNWWKLFPESREPLPWIRDSRPLNSLERRIAMTAAFFRKFTQNPLPGFVNEIMLSSAKDSAEKFLESIQIHDPFWDQHTGFKTAPLKNKAALLGKSRALEYIINVIVPAARAYALVRRDAGMLSSVEKFYLSLPKMESNRTLKIMNERCFGVRKNVFATAAAMQGVIHIFRTYCERNAFDCRICRLYDSV